MDLRTSLATQAHKDMCRPYWNHSNRQDAPCWKHADSDLTVFAEWFRERATKRRQIAEMARVPSQRQSFEDAAVRNEVIADEVEAMRA